MAPKTILVVEDDEAIAALVSEVLLEEGYAVVVEPSTLEALKLAEATAPAATIFDFRLGAMDGREFYQRLRAVGVTTPAVLCSAWGPAEGIAAELGIAYLKKPFDLDDLVSVVAEAVRGIDEPHRE